MLGVVLALALTRPARAELIETWQNRSSLGDWSPFQIIPFDSSLGTLNSVTLSAEVNVTASAQLWSASEDAVLTVNFTTTLAAVPEMDLGPTVASLSDSTPLQYYDYDYGEGNAMLDGSGNNTAYNTITWDFGRFAGTDPFDIALELSGEATSTYPGDTVVSSSDGSASLYYAYDYTPTEVPEPGSLVLIGMSSLALLAFSRRSHCRPL